MSDLSLYQVSQELISLAQELSTKSLSSFNRSAHMSPICMVEDRLYSHLDEDRLRDLMQTITSVYASRYINAVSIGSDVRVVSTLNKFATDREALSALQGSSVLKAALESDRVEELMGGLESGTKTLDIEKHVNLAVGKVLEVPVRVGNQTIPVTTTIRIMPQILDTQEVVMHMANDSGDMTIPGRWRRYMRNEISLADYLTNRDVLRARRKLRINDKSGIQARKEQRQRSGAIATVLSGKGSVNAVSAINVVTKSTMAEVEAAMRGRMSSYRDRQRFFDSTLSATLYVVDPDRERVYLYEDGIPDRAEFTFSDIRDNGQKSNGVDINAVMRAYANATPAQF